MKLRRTPSLERRLEAVRHKRPKSILRQGFSIAGKGCESGKLGSINPQSPRKREDAKLPQQVCVSKVSWAEPLVATESSQPNSEVITLAKKWRVIGTHSVGKIRKVQVVRNLVSEFAERSHSRGEIGMAMRVLTQDLFDVLSLGGGSALEPD